MVTPNTLLIASRACVCKALAADSTLPTTPEVSVATTVRITLPALTVTVSTHAGEKHCSSWRKLALTESAFASYSSMVPPAFSTNVIFLAYTISLIAPGCSGDGGGGDGGGGSGLGDGGGGEGEGGGGLGDGGGGEGDGGGGLGDGRDGEGGGGGEGDGGGGGGDHMASQTPSHDASISSSAVRQAPRVMP